MLLLGSDTRQIAFSNGEWALDKPHSTTEDELAEDGVEEAFARARLCVASVDGVIEPTIGSSAS